METQKFSEYAWSIGASKNVLRLGTDDIGGRAMEDAARVWKTLDGDGTSLRERREPHHHGGADRPERPMAGDLRTQGRGCLFAPPTHARGGVPWGGTARGVPAAHAAASPCCTPSTDCAQQSRSSTHCRRLAHHKPRSRFGGCGLLHGSRGGGAAAPLTRRIAWLCASDDQVRGAWPIRIDLAPPLRTPP